MTVSRSLGAGSGLAARAGHLGHGCSVLADGEEVHEAVTDEHRGLLWCPLVHLYLEDVESGLDEAVGGLPVEAGRRNYPEDRKFLLVSRNNLTRYCAKK